MMCDNLSLYQSFNSAPSSFSSATLTQQFYPMDDDDDEHPTYSSVKRKFSDYEDNGSSLTSYEYVSPSFNGNNSDEEDEEDEDDEDDDDDAEEETSSGDDDNPSEDEYHDAHSVTRVTTPSTITQRRHSDTIHTSSLSYGTPIVKRRCTYSSMHDEEQKRSVLVESYRKLRGVKKPKLQVSLLICNLIKRLEKTFTKTPPQREQEEQSQPYVQYYQHRTAYRSSSSDSIYMSTTTTAAAAATTTTTTTTTTASLLDEELDRRSVTDQQYSPAHSSTYESDKVLLPVSELRPSSSSSMYHSPSSDAYWLAQSNFAVPVVSTTDDDDADVSLNGSGDYLDLSDNTLASSFSTCSSSLSSSSSPAPSSSSSVLSPSSPPPSTSTPPSELLSTSASISNDCCCSSTNSLAVTKLHVDTNNNNNNNNNNNDDYFVYHHHHHYQQPQQHHHHHHHFDHGLHSHDDSPYHPDHLSSTGQPFFYHHNGNNTVDIITTA